MKSPDIKDIRPGRGREPKHNTPEVAGSYRNPIMDHGDPNLKLDAEIPYHVGPSASRETPIVNNIQVTDEQGNPTSTILEIKPASRINPKTSSASVGKN